MRDREIPALPTLIVRSLTRPCQATLPHGEGTNIPHGHCEGAARGNPFPLSLPCAKGGAPQGRRDCHKVPYTISRPFRTAFLFPCIPFSERKRYKGKPIRGFPFLSDQKHEKAASIRMRFSVQRPLRPMQPIRSCRRRRLTQAKRPPQRVALQMRTLFSHPPYTLLGKEKV